jgi:hypothetical protein
MSPRFLCRESGPRDDGRMVQHSPEVDAWFHRYENPQKALAMAVRDLVLEADARVGECIKWQAPTFVYEGNIASFFPRAKKHVSLMFHSGAALPDPSGILEGEGATSRSLKILDHDDLAAKAPALQGLVRSWIESRDGAQSTRKDEGMTTGQGTAEDPWVLKTPPGTSEYQLYKDPDADPPALVCVVGATTLKYHLRAVEDLHQMLVERGDWVELGAADEQKAAKDGTVEAWARDESNPVGGWYGLRKGYRGRFGMYLPPLLEHLGLVELEHNPRNNRVRAT